MHGSLVLANTRSSLLQTAVGMNESTMIMPTGESDNPSVSYISKVLDGEWEGISTIGNSESRCVLRETFDQDDESAVKEYRSSTHFY